MSRARIPKQISRITGKQKVLADNGLSYPIGMLDSEGWVDVTRLGRDTSEQRNFNYTIARIAREVTLTSKFRYRDNPNGVDNIHGTMPEHCFNRTGYYGFISKPGILPSTCINEIFNSPMSIITECGIILQIIRYKAILEHVKEDEFNRLFSSGIEFQAPMRQSHPLFKFCIDTREPKKRKNILESPSSLLNAESIGGGYYIENIPPYLQKHPNGYFMGHNIIYVGKNKQGEHEFGGLFPEKKAAYLR